jgi:hypothetical protein
MRSVLTCSFAVHRDAKEMVQRFEGTVLGCIIAAFAEATDEFMFKVSFRLILLIVTVRSRSYRTVFAVQKKDKIFTSLDLDWTGQDTRLSRSAVKNDVVISSVPDKALNQFSTAEVELWLQAVTHSAAWMPHWEALALTADIAVNRLLAFIAKLLQQQQDRLSVQEKERERKEQESRGRRRVDKADDDDDIFSRATIASRALKSKPNSHAGLDMPGQQLLNKSLVEQTFQQELQVGLGTAVQALAQCFNQAVQKRNQFDRKVQEVDDEYKAQQRRLATSLVEKREKELEDFKLSKSRSTVVTSTPATDPATGSAGQDDFDDDDVDFAELTGGPVTRISKTITDAAAAAASALAAQTSALASQQPLKKKRKLNIQFN